MFTQRLIMFKCLNAIFRQKCNIETFYSRSLNIMSYNTLSKSSLFKNWVLVPSVNCKYVKHYSNTTKNINKEELKKYFDYLTESHENGKRENEVNKILEFNEVTVLLEDRKEIIKDLTVLRELVELDKEMKLVAAEEEIIYKDKLEKVESKLLEVITENICNEQCEDVIFEINAGVGGQEAMLFVKDLLQMYQSYFDYLNYDHEIIELGKSDLGGFRKVVITVSGSKALQTLQHEAGVHRVQRVPATENSGRIHTSVVSIAILPQPSEIEVNIDKQDLQIETKSASAPGGQNVNRTDSAVRITHLPTGIITECQTQRSQHQNMKVAMLKLRMKIYQDQLELNVSSSKELRKRQMGTKSRNERIRTYNYPQNRITDHRISENGTMHNLKDFLEGGEALHELQNKLQQKSQESALLNAINIVIKR